jgi:hypothetical protein
MIASLFLILAVSHILFDPPAKFLMEERATARGEILQAFLATRMDIFYRFT